MKLFYQNFSTIIIGSLFVLIVTSPTKIIGQIDLNRIDSLKFELTRPLSEYSKASNLYQISKAYSGYYPDSVVKYGLKTDSVCVNNIIGLKWAFIKKFKQIKMDNHQTIASSFMDQNKIPECIRHFESCIKLKMELDPRNTPYLYNNLAKVYMHFLVDQEKALKLCNTALQVTDKIEDPSGPELRIRIQTLSIMAMIYEEMEDYEKAIEYNKKCLSASYDLEHDKMIALTCNNLASNFIRFGIKDSAMFYYNQGLNFAEKNNRLTDVAYIRTHLATVYTSEKNYEMARAQLDSIAAIVHSCENTTLISKFLTARSSLEFEEGNLAKSEKYALEALKSAATEKVSIVWPIAKILKDIYKVKHDFPQALKYSEMYFTLRDSAQKMDNKFSALKLETKYQIESSQKKARIDLLQRENKIQQLEGQQRLKNTSIVVVTMMAFILLLLLIIWRRSIKNKIKIRAITHAQEIELQTIEIETLRSKINDELTKQAPIDMEILEAGINNFLESPLSEREIDVLNELARGSNNNEIAERLNVSIHTVKSHLSNIYNKLDVANRMLAIKKIGRLSKMNGGKYRDLTLPD